MGFRLLLIERKSSMVWGAAMGGLTHWWSMGLILMFLSGCGEGEPSDPRAQSGSSTEEVTTQPAMIRGASLRGSIDAFTDVASCVDGVAGSIPIEVDEALRDLGQDQLALQICEALSAVKRGDEAACDALVLSTARRACRTRLAIWHRRPEACPPDRVLRGREPECLAWSSGSPLLCQALASDPAETCRAVLSSDEGSCAEVAESERSRCAFFKRRYASVSGRGVQRAVSMSTLLEVVWTRTRSSSADGEGRERFAFGRWGVAVERRADGDHLILEDPILAPEQVGLRASSNRWLSFEARLPHGEQLPARRLCPADCSVDFRGRPDATLNTEGLTTGHVDWAEFTPERGARVLVHFRLSQEEGTGRTEARGRVRSFVRDVIDLREPPESEPHPD